MTPDWTINNYNTHIAQHLKKQRQSENEVWLANKIQHRKYFTDNETGKVVPDLLFL